MAQNLLKFNTENEYRTAKINHLIVPSVSYVNETGNVYITGVLTDKMDAEAGDIIAFNVSDNSMVFIKPEAFTSEMTSKYTPVAVVVVPYQHTTDNSVVGMSLKSMSISTPVIGSLTTSGITWGDSIESNTKHNNVVCISLEDNNVPSATLSNATMSYLPSDAFYNSESTLNNIVDVYTKWFYRAGTFTPSPYLFDGTQSGRYVTTELDNAFSDMTVKDFSSESNSIAGYLCTQYNVPLYKGVGQWYLPSIGELGYLVARSSRIAYALQQLKNAGRAIAGLLTDDKPYWSSTLTINNSKAWCVTLTNGLVASSSLENENYVRAFARF